MNSSTLCSPGCVQRALYTHLGRGIKSMDFTSIYTPSPSVFVSLREAP